MWGRSGGKQGTSLAKSQFEIRRVDMIIKAWGKSDIAVPAAYPPASTQTRFVRVCDSVKMQHRGSNGSWVKSFWLPRRRSHRMSLIFFNTSFPCLPPAAWCSPRHTKTTALKMLLFEEKYAGMYSDAKLDFSIRFIAVMTESQAVFGLPLLLRIHNYRGAGTPPKTK